MIGPYKINKLTVNWRNESLSAFGPSSRHKTIINRETKTLTIQHPKSYGGYYYEIKIPISEERIEEFFLALEQVKFEDDYSVPVCDGFSWDMTIRVGGLNIKSKGTIEPPTGTAILEKMIYDMIKESGFEQYPQLWGN